MSHQSTTAEATETAGADIVVVDYGLGNLRSVTRGLERVGATVTITDDPAVFEAADGIVLPGVGAFREGMDNAGPYRDALEAAVDRGQPVFGICLGMQMLLGSSEEAAHAGEGDVEGLNFIPGTNVRFSGDLKVPHMGWNNLTVTSDHPIADGIDGEYAYFVHSYYAVPDSEDAVVATSEYESTFPAIVANEAGNVFGTQFHPEKSGETGLQILQNFVTICME
ncbi:imidazole glycerol phosphate synthase subunit HisH [Natronocalculus amylovorans]|uniref:Imidazole glycerol phosphate synthase subunit HisH n=1 Tax=Natronocalculus amylovorans TaxID=2917812 RepID=A0AAE3K975_9EURY|nr:imidazole glycerol phosphate synthase subunit HisH [Natronocalculus amylovorans]MCL9815759.1 imidazole glycerol phosphate synthase subunit HisH [Natronocalculus amylovorans]